MSGSSELRRSRLAAWLRPDDDEAAWPPARALRTALRTAHIVCFAALYGGHVYGVEADRLVPALVSAVATGGALSAFEIAQSRLWLVQVRGVATLAKLALVVAVAVFWEWRVVLLTAVVVIGAVTSHMPGRYRYYSLLHGRSIGHDAKG